MVPSVAINKIADKPLTNEENCGRSGPSNDGEFTVSTVPPVGDGSSLCLGSGSIGPTIPLAYGSTYPPNWVQATLEHPNITWPIRPELAILCRYNVLRSKDQ